MNRGLLFLAGVAAVLILSAAPGEPPFKDEVDAVFEHIDSGCAPPGNYIPSAEQFRCAWNHGAAEGSRDAQAVNRWSRERGIDPGPSPYEMMGRRPECAVLRARHKRERAAGDADAAGRTWDALAAEGC